ncbi:hypothetical protein SISNIDRAFT_484953 [Sistotremastrum niveocremeum HHB9708]|uniref:AA9 family lytic polysaccharide monooxygenase n=1 Tax=Sistotremastrum niveocremeum HHB9708 TaxID=1314777 RepID=A0A164VB18_9AGAM|nr:hypothetical protein SISNIDRAFT_484953 [Sistotremastrum niveocremeum HHB9708]
MAALLRAPKFLALLVTIACTCVPVSLALTRMTAISVNGGPFITNSTRLPPNTSPVTDVTSPNIACNVGGTTPAPAVTVISAGSNLTALWIPDTHVGPNIVYVAKVTGNILTTTNLQGLRWIKARIVDPTKGPTPGGWSAPLPNGEYSFLIPTRLACGQYFLRIESIGFHAASSIGGAQFFLSCVQIDITGGGGGYPVGTGILLPGGYTGTDPGIVFNPYTTPYPTSYPFPGGPTWPDGKRMFSSLY